MGLTIPYQWHNVDRCYEPDYLVRLATPATGVIELTAVLDIKGMLTEEDKAKHEAARRWVCFPLEPKLCARTPWRRPA
ncbi:MAG: hypothetical protein WBF43_00815 [Methylocella sp.]